MKMVTNGTVKIFNDIKPEVQSVVMSNMIGLAADKHKGQLDKAGQPYILHPLRVMNNVNTFSEKLLAIGHDLFEDTNCCECDVIEALNLLSVGETAYILNGIYSLSRINISYNLYINRMMCEENAYVIPVKIADITDNLDIYRLRYVPEKLDADRLRKYINTRCKLELYLQGE